MSPLDPQQIRAVARALLDESIRLDSLADDLRGIADAPNPQAIIKSWSCCPLCGEVRCDDDCEMRDLRQTAEPQG